MLLKPTILIFGWILLIVNSFLMHFKSLLASSLVTLMNSMNSTNAKKKKDICINLCQVQQPVWLLGVKYNVQLGKQKVLPQGAQDLSKSQIYDKRTILQSDDELDLQVITVEEQLQGLKIAQLLLEDFESIIWFTYRKEFTPIPSIPLLPAKERNSTSNSQKNTTHDHHGIDIIEVSHSDKTSNQSYWSKMSKVFSSSGYTSDAGWGCMMRSGQMMLARALVTLHLGRDWRLPPQHTNANRDPSINNGNLTDEFDEYNPFHQRNPQSSSNYYYSSTKKLLHYPRKDIEFEELNTLDTSDGAELVVPNSASHLPPDYHMILGLFIDRPECPFSIHKISRCGINYNKKIGEWYGPTTISLVLQKLVNIYSQDVCVYVAEQGCIYINEVIDLCTKKNVTTRTTSSSTDEKSKASNSSSYSKPSSHNVNNPNITSSSNSSLPSNITTASSQTSATTTSSSTSETTSTTSTKNDNNDLNANTNTWKPVIILIPLRLGLDKINPMYTQTLCKVFEIPQTLGIIGGKPKSSLYFVGCQGSELLYLDPHTVQKTGDSYRTYHCDIPKKVKIKDVDPSLALGFFCKDQKDFDSFLKSASTHLASAIPIICIQDKKKTSASVSGVIELCEDYMNDGTNYNNNEDGSSIDHNGSRRNDINDDDEEEDDDIVFV